MRALLQIDVYVIQWSGDAGRLLGEIRKVRA